MKWGDPPFLNEANVKATHEAGRADSRRNRQRLIDAAEAVFEQDGAGASLEEIARRAGVGSATLHRHFPSRQLLLNAVFHEGVCRLVERAKQLLDELAPQAALVRWLGELTAYTSTTRGLATALLADPEGKIAAEDSCHGLINDAATLLVTQAAQAGALRAEVQPHDLVMLTNAISLASEGKPDHAARLLDLALGGILKAAATIG